MKRLFIAVAALAGLVTINLAPAHASDCTPGPHLALANCSFKDQDLTGVDLTGSNLTGADLTNTNLTSAILTGVSSANIVGTPSNLPEDWQLLYGYLVGPAADLSSAVFANKDLTNANFVDANLTSANLAGATLANADFDGATLTSVAGRDIKGTPLNLPNPWKLYNGTLIGPSADLSGVNLGNINLNNFDIENANLNYTVFDGADLTNIDFTSNSIIGLALYNCNLTGTDFTGLDLENIRATGVIGTPVGLPSNFRIKNGFLIGPYANLSSLNLSNINFSGTNLHHVDLAAANLTGANLSGIDLTLTTLRGVNLTNTNITNANLTGVNLTGVYSSGLVGTPIGLSSDWQLYEGILIGPRANLAGVNFTGKDLRQAHLKGVGFQYANFTNANLAGVDLSDTDLSTATFNGTNITGTNLTNAKIDGAYGINLVGTPIGLASSTKIISHYLVGPKVNLNNADLAGQNLSGIDLSGTSLLYTDFSNTNLSGANLTGSNVDGANFTSANLTNVITNNLTGTPSALPNTVQLVGGIIVGVFTKSPTPTIQGKANVGNLLTAVTGIWDEGVAKSYSWLRNGVPITDATASTYSLTSADVNQNISVTVTGTITGGLTRSRTSDQLSIAVGTMRNTATKILGKVSVGKTVSASTTSWAPGSTTSYKWLLDGKAIKGATKQTIKLTAKHKGHKLSVEIKQVAPGYKSLTKTSSPTVIK